MTKFVKKSKKKNYLGDILGLFAQLWPEANFSGKKGSASFYIFQLNYPASCQKSEKTIEPILRKTPNWWTDRQADRRSDKQTMVIL